MQKLYLGSYLRVMSQIVRNRDCGGTVVVVHFDSSFYCVSSFGLSECHEFLKLCQSLETLQCFQLKLLSLHAWVKFIVLRIRKLITIVSKQFKHKFSCCHSFLLVSQHHIVFYGLNHAALNAKWAHELMIPIIWVICWRRIMMWMFAFLMIWICHKKFEWSILK